MAKIRCFLLFLLLMAISFVANAQNRSIFIEGVAASAQHHAFFLDNFRLEGRASGYDIIDNRADAAYVFRF